MRFCEEKVKSGESPGKSAATSYSRTSEYAALFEPTTQIAAPHPSPLPRERGWPVPIPRYSYSPAPQSQHTTSGAYLLPSPTLDHKQGEKGRG